MLLCVHHTTINYNHNIKTIHKPSTHNPAQDVHMYTSDFPTWSDEIYSECPPGAVQGEQCSRGAVVTEAGARWFVGTLGDSGSPLTVLNYLKNLKNSSTSSASSRNTKAVAASGGGGGVESNGGSTSSSHDESPYIKSSLSYHNKSTQRKNYRHPIIQQ